MPVTVNHSTPADGTFSATGAVAWDANHTLSGFGSMAEQNSNNVLITGGSISGVSGLGTVTSVSGTGTVNGITLTGTITSSGSLTLGGTLSGVSLTTQVSGTLPVGNGGTGATTLTGVVIGNGASAFTTVTAPSGAIVGTTDTQTLTNKTITAINYRETVGSIASGTLDLSTGNVFSNAPSANITYVFSNPPAFPTAYGFTLKVTPSATVTITWPASVDWPGGTAPTAPASGETDVFVFYTQDGGTTYYGFVAGDAMA